MARILVVDDEAGLRDSLRRALTRQGHSVDDASTVDEAIQRLTLGPFDLVLTDIRLKDRSGLEIVTFARQNRPDARIVVMTAFGSVNVAVDAMRLGADDFLEKPFRMETIINRLTRVLESVRLARQVERLERENEILRGEMLETQPADSGLVGCSVGMSRVRDLIGRVAATEASVLIRGETGTGKELVARAIHRLSRAERPFVAFDCSAFAEGVLESELFGHEKGAFTGADRRRIGRFELADTGTLFLDEIGDLAPGIQVKLLRVLQERAFARVGGTETVAVDVRILAATNRDLEAAMRAKTFREDLYYRLNVVTVEVPPLRERRDDIPALVELFLARYGRRDAGMVRVAPEALAALQADAWPGNVRQLENVVHRATVLCRDGLIQLEDVTLELGERSADGPLTTDLRATLNALEQGLLERAIREHHGNLTAAGRALGIERNLLRYKLRKHGLR